MSLGALTQPTKHTPRMLCEQGAFGVSWRRGRGEIERGVAEKEAIGILIYPGKRLGSLVNEEVDEQAKCVLSF